MAGAIFIALDQGGQSSRAIAFDEGGAELASASRPVTTTRPAPGHVELDGDEIVDGLWESLDEVLAALGDDAQRVARIGMATQRSSVAFWEVPGLALLAPCLSWQDTRAARDLARHADEFALIHRETGLWPSAHHGASKLAWGLRHFVPVATARSLGQLRCGPLAAFLAARLTESERAFVDPNNAGRTLLWNRWTRDWDPYLMSRFEVSVRELPVCRPSEGEHGTVQTRVGSIPFELLLGDQPAALFSAGVPDPRSIYVNLGTGAFCLRVLEDASAECPRLLKSLAWSNEEGDEAWVIEGTVNGCGSALEWARSTLGIAAEPDELDAALAATGEPPLFLNTVSGLGSPWWRSGIAPRFVGEGDARQRLAAVLESIVFLLARNIAELRRLDPPFTGIVATGGLSNVDGICRRLSSLSGVPVTRPAQVEATARGTAWLLAGRPAEWIVDAAAPSVFEPDADEALRARYVRFVRELEAASA